MLKALERRDKRTGRETLAECARRRGWSFSLPDELERATQTPRRTDASWGLPRVPNLYGGGACGEARTRRDTVAVSSSEPASLVGLALDDAAVVSIGMESADGQPSVFQWTDASAAFTRMTRLFYEKLSRAAVLRERRRDPIRHFRRGVCLEIASDVSDVRRLAVPKPCRLPALRPAIAAVPPRRPRLKASPCRSS